MKHKTNPSIESLESRALFSTALTAPTPNVAASTSQDVGFTLRLTESTPFTGEVAFHASPVFDPPYQLTASINWGDGTTSAGTERLTSGSGTFGYETLASHTYSRAGTFKVVTTLTLKSIVSPPPVLPPIFVATIDSTAIVADEPESHLGGVQFSEVATRPFTAKVGTFDFTNTGLALSASIDWGDGHTSAGTITQTGGDDYTVTASHTYARKGTYRPHIVVTARPIPVPGKPTPQFILLVASFHSIIDVAALS